MRVRSGPKIDPENPEWTEADLAAAQGPEALLSSRWHFFRERFGDFYVEGPVSESLQSFLAKRGDGHLMTWPSRRAEHHSETVEA